MEGNDMWSLGGQDHLMLTNIPLSVRALDTHQEDAMGLRKCLVCPGLSLF